MANKTCKLYIRSKVGYPLLWVAGILCIAVIISVGVVNSSRTPASEQPASSVSSSTTPVSQTAEQSVGEAPAPSNPTPSPTPDSSPQTMASATSRSDDEASIQEAVEGWANAFRARDADRFAAYYAPEVEQFFRKKDVNCCLHWSAAFRRGGMEPEKVAPSGYRTGSEFEQVSVVIR